MPRQYAHKIMYHNLLFPDEPNFHHHVIDDDFEPHFSLNKKIPIHDNLDGSLNLEYHVNYAPLFSQERQYPWIKNSLHAIHKMAGIKAQPYISYGSASSHQARDIILYEFVLSCLEGQDPPDSKKNLVASMSQVLRENGFETEEIHETLSAFDSDITIDQFHAAFIHQNVIKARGQCLLLSLLFCCD